MKLKRKSIQLINTIKIFIIKRNLLQPNQSILLAMSGGQDSIYLLIIFFILKKQWDLNINVLYCNHLWQQNSLYTYFHISKISFCLNIEVLFSITLKDLKSEEQSRYWRSKNYYRLIEFKNSSTIGTGHTLTDQIETFFFNTIRGTGFKINSGLKEKKTFSNLNKNDFLITQSEFINFLIIKKSFLFKKAELKKKVKKFQTKKITIISKKKFLIRKKKSLSLKIIRPLIKKTRFDIKNICKTWKLPLLPDQTNQETKYSRNRLRKQVVPTFRFFFNPKVDLNLSRQKDILFEEDNYIENIITKLLQKVINEDQNGYFLNLSLFCSLALPLQRRVCFYFFKEKLKVDYNFLIIDSFIFFSNNFFGLGKKINKVNFQTKKILCIFFPEIGTIYISKTLFIFLK
jgi:tRNA(Ile)-lysidine synthase TilS/MesJ